MSDFRSPGPREVLRWIDSALASDWEPTLASVRCLRDALAEVLSSPAPRPDPAAVEGLRKAAQNAVDSWLADYGHDGTMEKLRAELAALAQEAKP